MITVKEIDDTLYEEGKKGTAGGFGNQLFKYAAALSYSFDNSTEVVLPKWHFNEYLKHPPKRLEDFEDVIFEDFHDTRGQKIVEIPKDRNINLNNEGYFQDLRYINHNRNNIISKLEIKDEYKEKFFSLLEKDIPDWKHLNLSFIHVRRGDYHLIPYILPIQSKEYYDCALEHINYDKCIVFSADIEWCKNTFKYPNLVYLNYSDKYFDMFIMSLCNSGVIANSTYSWWGAYLNKNSPKIIKPKYWFSSIVEGYDHSNSKIKLEDWIEV